MSTSLNKVVLATIVLPHSKDLVLSGGAGPVFVAANKEEQQRVALYMSRITEGVVHDLENGVLVVVKH